MKTILIAHNYSDSSFASMSYTLAHHLADAGNRVVFISHKPYFNETKSIKKEKGEIIVCSWPTQKRPTSIKDFFWYSKLYQEAQNRDCKLRLNTQNYFSISFKLSIFLLAKKPLISSKCSFTRLFPNSNTFSAKPSRKSRS